MLNKYYNTKLLLFCHAIRENKTNGHHKSTKQHYNGWTRPRLKAEAAYSRLFTGWEATDINQE